MQMMGLKLTSGAVMPTIGISVRVEDVTLEAIISAIEIGYRCFDTAREYSTEPLLGEALARAFKAGLVRREDVFVTTKLRPVDADPADVVAALQSSLSDLQLDNVDLFLVHWPVRAKKTIDWHNIKPGDLMAIDQKELWQAMESCVDAGLAKATGVCNWSVKKLEELLAHARIPPAVNQVEVHPVWRQDKLREYCRQKGIVITSYSPLGAPGSYYGCNQVISINDVMTDTIKEIAQRDNRTPGQIIVLLWLSHKGLSAAVRDLNTSRLKGILDALSSCTLSAADIQMLDSISEQKRVVTGSWFIQPEHGPFKSLTDLWDE